MVKFKNVNKSFGNIKALSDASFEIADGEFVFLVGPSGAGKTTILRLLLGEFTPTSGSIIFDGEDISHLKSKDIPRVRQKIGIVFQDFKLLRDKTIRENIEVALAIKGVERDKWKGLTDAALKLVGLTNRGELFPLQLSGGEIQRVAIARALVVDPKIILADEPTGNLDWETGEAIMNLLLRINKSGKTILVASHNREIIDKMKKRVIKIKDGKVVASEKGTDNANSTNESKGK